MSEMVSETFRPHSPLPHLKRLVCMEMNRNVPNFPTIEVPLNFQNNLLHSR